MSQQEELLKQKLSELLSYCNELKKEAEAKDYEIRNLKKKVETQERMLEENYANTLRYKTMVDEQKADIEADRRMIESLRNNDDLDTKEMIIRGLEEQIARLEEEAATRAPPTPETAESSNSPATTTDQPDKETSEDHGPQRKKRRLGIEDGLQGCQVVGLKFRTQGVMLKVKLNNTSEYALEYDAEEVVQKYENEVREYVEKLKQTKSRQIYTILRKKIECLTKLI